MKDQDLLIIGLGAVGIGTAIAYALAQRPGGPPAQQYTVAVNSNCPGVVVTVGGQPVTTPGSASVAPGVVAVTAPATATIGGIAYRFVSWSDGSAALTRYVDIGADTVLGVIYEVWVPADTTPPTLSVAITQP